jgi:hypothetical protein
MEESREEERDEEEEEFLYHEKGVAKKNAEMRVVVAHLLYSAYQH